MTMSHPKAIIAAAAAVFAQFEATKELYVTEDGNAFMPHVKNLADNHARTSRLPAPVLVKRSEVLEAIEEQRAAIEQRKAGKPKPAPTPEALPASGPAEGSASPEAMTSDAGSAAGEEGANGADQTNVATEPAEDDATQLAGSSQAAQVPDADQKPAQGKGKKGKK